MEIKITTKRLLNILLIISWIIFIGVCVEAGGFIFNTIFTLFIKPVGARYFWEQIDLSALFAYDKGHFIALTSIMIIVAVLRAIIFYLILKLMYNKNVSMAQPFTKDVVRFIQMIGYITLAIAFFSRYGSNYSAWLRTEHKITIPDVQYLRLAGADVWLFMGVTLFVIAQVFKRGIEMQKENELTV
jgi:hypothetical protein